MTIPFYGAAFFNAKTGRVKAVVAALSLLPLINLVLTSSRSSWIGFVVSIFVYIFLKNRRLIPIFILAGIAAIPLIPGFMIERMLTLGRDTSSTYRLDIWKGALGVLKDYWATGVGIGPQPFIKLFRNYSSALVPAHSHMLPLQIWLELGIAGIASFIWLVVRLVKKGMIIISGKKDGYTNNIIIASIASLAGIFTIGMVEYVWFYPRTLNMFWIDMGIFLIAVNLSEGRLLHDSRTMSQAERL
jgi:putative inorganic carbon (HCO3(-)) transporter